MGSRTSLSEQIESPTSIQLFTGDFNICEIDYRTFRDELSEDEKVPGSNDESFTNKSHGTLSLKMSTINNPVQLPVINLCSLDPIRDQQGESEEQPLSQVKTFGPPGLESSIGEGKKPDDPQTVNLPSPVKEIDDGAHSAQRVEDIRVDSTETPHRAESDLHPDAANQNHSSHLCVSADEGEKEDARTDINGSSDLSVMRDDIPKQVYSSDNSTEAGIHDENDIEDKGDDSGEMLLLLNDENQTEQEDEAETGGMQFNPSDCPASTEARMKASLQPFY
jgi:hypothetical protein